MYTCFFICTFFISQIFIECLLCARHYIYVHRKALEGHTPVYIISLHIYSDHLSVLTSQVTFFCLLVSPFICKHVFSNFSTKLLLFINKELVCF